MKPKVKVNQHKLPGKAHKLENYNFMTPEGQREMTYRNYFNPWWVLKNKCFLNINIDYRNGGRSVNFYKAMFNIYYKNRKAKFIMIRRTEEDIKALKKAFLTKAREGGVDTSEFRAQEDGVYHEIRTKGGTLKLKIKVIEFIALSMVDRKRFNSVEPEDVEFILFDEFISKTGDYLSNEPVLLLDIVQTYLRRAKGCKLIMIGNNVDEQTIYHSFFKIPPALKDYRRSRTLTYNGYTYRFYSQKKPAAYFDRELGGTDAYDITKAFDKNNYAYKGNPRNKQRPLIKKIHEDYKFRFIFKYDTWEFGVWENNKTNKILIHDKFNSTCKSTYCFRIEDSQNAYMMPKSVVKNWLQAHYKGNIEFGDSFIENEIIKALKHAESLDKYF